MKPDSNDRKQALEDLSVIRQTMDRATGSSYLADYSRGAGAILLVFGVLAIAAAAFTQAVLGGALPVPRPPLAIGLAWVLVVTLTGMVKTAVMKRRAAAAGMSVWGYGLRIMSPGAFHAVLPVALGALALLVHFWRAGEIACVPALLTLYVGAIYAAFGAFYLSRVVVIGAYEMAILGSVGLLFMTGRVTLYLALVGAVFAADGVVMMVTLGRRPDPVQGNTETPESADA